MAYRSYRKRGSRTGNEVQDLIDNILRSQERLTQNQIPVKEEKPRRGTLKQIFDVLRRGETAPAVLASLEGRDATTAYAQSVFGKYTENPVTYEDVLTKIGVNPKGRVGKFAKGAAGLALDIFGDPKTYLTLGASGFAKVATKFGQKTLTKSGTSLLRKATTKLGERQGTAEVADMVRRGIIQKPKTQEELSGLVQQFGARRARQMVGTMASEKSGERLIQKEGLKFMGQQVVPKDVLARPFRAVGRVAAKTPLLGSASKWVKNAFEPFAEVKNLPGGQEYVDSFQGFTRATKQKVYAAADEIARRRQVIVSKVGADVPRQLTIGGEIGYRQFQNMGKNNQLVSDALDFIRDNYRKTKFAEQKRGILQNVLPEDEYVFRHLTKEARELLQSGRATMADFSRPLRISSRESRKLDFKTIDAANKWSQEKLGVKMFEEDAFRALASRQIKSIKDVALYDWFKEIGTKFGRRVSSEERVIVNPVTGQKIKDTRMFPKVIDGIQYRESLAPQLKGILFPEPIVKHIDDTQKYLSNDESLRGFLGFYDRLLGIWKGQVTGYFPAFHTRNMIGGLWNNFLGDVRNPLRYIQSEQILARERGRVSGNTTRAGILTTKTGTKYTYDEVINLYRKMGGGQQSGPIDVDKMLDINKAVGAKGALQGVANYPRFIMGQVEDRLRLPVFIDRLIRGSSPEDAMKEVFKYHFDYAPESLAPFERSVMRRLMPFYVWTRNNVPLQIKKLIERPGKFAGLEKARRAIENIDPVLAEDKESLPDWMKEMFLIRLPGEDEAGMARYLQLDLPVEDLGKLGTREIIGMLSPALKFPVEQIANRNLYFGSELYNPDLPREQQTAGTIEIIKNLPGPIKKFLNFKEGQRKNYRTGEMEPYYEMDARRLHIIQSFLGRWYSSTKQASDQESTTAEKLSRLVGGVPIRSVDPAEVEYQQLYEQNVKLQELLKYYRRRGMIAEIRSGGRTERKGRYKKRRQ